MTRVDEEHLHIKTIPRNAMNSQHEKMWGQLDHTHVRCSTDTAWLRVTDRMQNITARSIITASNGEHPWQGGDVEEEVRPLDTTDCERRIDLCEMLFVGDPFVSPSAVILYLSPPLSKRHLRIADPMGNFELQKTRMVPTRPFEVLSVEELELSDIPQLSAVMG